jgi:sulfate transport system ATP-binding protein
VSVLVRGVERRFGDSAALHAVDLTVSAGEFVALLGPSGSGKTTLLRILAGLDVADGGSISIDGQDMTHVPARLRRIGFVFQHYALFRHMTIFENVAFGLRIRRRPPPEAEIAQRVNGLLARVQIADLARALAIEPRLLLLDEPFGALDAEVRKGLRRWLRDLHRELGLTSLFVTHDQEEAMELADRVAVMRDGQIVQYDTPEALMDRPINAFVAGFLGDAARLPAEWDGTSLRIGGAHLPPLSASALRHAPSRPGPAVAFIRPHEWLAAPGEGSNATVRARHPVSRGVRLELSVGEHVVEAELSETSLRPGDTCQLSATAARAYDAG